MTAWVQKLRDGFAVMTGKPAPAELRGLRDKRDAHRVAHDLNRFGRFAGVVTFRTGRRVTVELPVGLGQGPVTEASETNSTEGSVDDL